MSAPPSPIHSGESDDRPSTSESAQQTKKPGHGRSISFEDTKPRTHSPRRRSIQFNVGAAEAQLPTRSPSVKEKKLSFGGDQFIREDEDESDREQRHHSITRGPSPPPPKYVLILQREQVRSILMLTYILEHTNGVFHLTLLIIAMLQISL